MTMNTIIRAKELVKTYTRGSEEVRALDRVSVDVGEGEEERDAEESRPGDTCGERQRAAPSPGHGVQDDG